MRVHARLADGLEHSPRAIPVPEAKLRRLRRPRRLHPAPQGVGDRHEVVGVHELEGVALEQIARSVSQQPLHRGARVAEDAVFAQDGDDVGGVVDEGAEVLLALAKCILGAGAVNRGRQDVRHRLYEVRVVHRELAPLCRMGPQDAEGAILALHHDAQPTHHLVLGEERRAPEAAVGGEVVHHDGRRGPQHIAGEGVAVRRKDGVANAPVLPSHTRPQHQRAALRPELEQPRVFHIESTSDEAHRVVQEDRQRRPRQSELAEVRHRFLLAGRDAQRLLGGVLPLRIRLLRRSHQLDAPAGQSRPLTRHILP